MSLVKSPSILAPPHFNPSRFSSNDPIIMFCIQAGIIIVLSRILGFGLGKLRQPKVISEVIAGIILGPSIMGRIPGFTDHIFNPISLPYLNLVATLGLCLFLFVVGLEVDFTVFARNKKASILISTVGMVIPFGLGAAVSVGLYHRYIDTDRVEFGHFLLFVAVAMAITAFPVLARILIELKLLKTNVGVTVLAAGVGNDVVGWVLLALTITLVNAGPGVTAVYVLLCAVGWVLALCFIVRPLFILMCRRNGSFEGGPTNATMVVIILLVLLSSFVTDILGVHAMFGGFMVGVIMPKTGNFAEHVTEKIEDLVSVLFLPIYFTLSGLKTDLGLLNNGSIWGWAVCVIASAFASKFLGCAVAARMSGFNWRESAAVGSLMSCKGLVELIVLNVGLQAGILSSEVFAMFVLMALITTFATTPLVLLFYPESYRNSLLLVRRENVEKMAASVQEDRIRKRFVVVLNRPENLPLTMAFTKLIHTPIIYDPTLEQSPVYGTTVDAIRLVELTDRVSALIQASSDLEHHDDTLCNIYRTFASLNGFNVRSRVNIVAVEAYAETVADFATEKAADMVIVPWNVGPSVSSASHRVSASSPLENIFKTSAGESSQTTPQYAAFVRSIFLNASCDVGLFLKLDSLSTSGSAPAIPFGRQHIYFPYHGGPDDRSALHFIVQLCQHPGVSATITRFSKALDTSSSKASSETAGDPSLAHITMHGGVAGGDTIYSGRINDTQSETADNLALAQYNFDNKTSPSSRISYSSVSSATPLQDTLAHLEQISRQHEQPLLVIVGRSRRAAPSHREELAEFLEQRITDLGIATSSEVRKSLGDVATAVAVQAVAASLLVVQSKA